MIIELEKDANVSYAIISEMAAEYGNTLERIHGSGPVDTLHVIGDPRELHQHAEYLSTLAGVGRVWRISSSYKNIARKVASADQKSVRRSSRVVEIPGPDGHVRKFGDGANGRHPHYAVDCRQERLHPDTSRQSRAELLGCGIQGIA